MSTKAKKDIVYGKFELDPDEFSPKNVKVRITTFIDEDALTEFKTIAELQGTKYQTLLNQVIRGFVSGSKGNNGSDGGGLTVANVRRIVREEIKKKQA
ncbi:MAG: hypothetical protein KA715_02345 [Xanthomonadaceae bacterium]|nr:hypothetical protein [Xanthomonadaceae bacterium]